MITLANSLVKTFMIILAITSFMVMGAAVDSERNNLASGNDQIGMTSNQTIEGNKGLNNTVFSKNHKIILKLHQVNPD